MRFPPSFLLCVLGSTLVLFVKPLHGATIQQLHVITRHGSRYPLRKHPSLLDEHTSGRLTATGVQQMHDLGLWLRQEYPPIFDTAYDDERHRHESSGYHRTLVSAAALAAAAWNTTGISSSYVPIYSVQPENDVVIRPYDKCPVFMKSLSTLYQSDEWRDLQSNHTNLLQELATWPQIEEIVTTGTRETDDSVTIVPLESVWNVYDMVTVADVECGVSSSSSSSTFAVACDPAILQRLTEIRRTELHAVAQAAELLKYRNDNIASLSSLSELKVLGSNLVQHVLFSNYTFSLHSGHYPTLLGFLSAMDMELEELPSYASAIIVEVDDQDRVTVLYKSSESLVVTVLAKHVARATLLVSPAAHNKNAGRRTSLQDWCSACGNVHADVCLQQQVLVCTGTEQSREKQQNLGILLGVAALLVCWVGAAWLWIQCRLRRRQDDKAAAVAATQSLDPPCDETLDTSSRRQKELTLT